MRAIRSFRTLACVTDEPANPPNPPDAAEAARITIEAMRLIREAMKRDDDAGPIGGEGKVVEADETYFGKAENPRPSPQRVKQGRPYIKRKAPWDKRAVVALVERGGEVRVVVVGVGQQHGIDRADIERQCTPVTLA